MDALNLLESSYPTPPETPSALFTAATYRVPNEHDEDPHNTDFEPWKAAFAAERLAQSDKLRTLQSQHRIEEIKDSIIKKNIEIVMKISQELKSLHQKQLLSESKSHRDLKVYSFRDLFK